ASRADDAAFERAVNTPARGIGDRTLDEVRRRARERAQSLWDAASALVSENALAARARNAVAGFLSLIEVLDAETTDLDLKDRVDHVLARSNLREHWSREARGQLDAEARLENLDVLVLVALRFSRAALSDELDTMGRPVDILST